MQWNVSTSFLKGQLDRLTVLRSKADEVDDEGFRDALDDVDAHMEALRDSIQAADDYLDELDAEDEEADDEDSDPEDDEDED